MSENTSAKKGKISQNINIIIAFILIAAIMVSTLIWALTYRIKSVINVSGISEENTIVCYVDAETAKSIETGMSVKINDKDGGSVILISDTPLSKAEILTNITGDYHDYIAASLNLSEWNYKITISPDYTVENNKIVSLSIITGYYRPIDLLGTGK